MLEGAEAGDGVEAPVLLRRQLSGVSNLDLEAVATARCRLRRGQRHPDPVTTALADEGQQRPPAAAEVQHPHPWLDPDLLGDVLVLSALSLLEAEREITVVLCAAEVSQLAEAEPKDPVDQRVGELEVGAIGHAASVSGPGAGPGLRGLSACLPNAGLGYPGVRLGWL